MRSLITLLAATLTSSALTACDQGLDAPTTTQGANSVAAPSYDTASLDPMLLATCHAAYRDAVKRIEDKRIESAICLEDSDCTIAVAETACTGELASAIHLDAEYAFLGVAARVDARHCARLPAECTPAPAEDAEPLAVACLSNRCTIVHE